MLELRIEDPESVKSRTEFYLPLLKEAGFNIDKDIFSYEDMWTNELVFQQEE